jgi:hypothetical protein
MYSFKGAVMSNKWVLVTSILSLASAGALQAHPMDSPDIVYIDGLPCNSACQSYMAWSRQTLSVSRQRAPGQLAKRPTDAATRRTPRDGGERLKPLASPRVAKQAVPILHQVPRTAIATVQRADNPAATSDTTPAKIADSPAVVSMPANAGTRTIQEQVEAATTLAEHVTAATSVPATEQRSENADPSDHAAVQSNDAEKTKLASPDNTDNLVALLMVRPEIKSVSDLATKDIAIEDRQSASSTSVRAAIAAAGAAEAQLSESHTKAIDRLVNGDVPAAVLAVVSPEAAEWFPDIKGFKIFRIPLAPPSLKAHL